MKHTARYAMLVVVLALLSAVPYAQESAPAKLADAEKQESPELRKAKDRVEECRKLFREGKQNEAIQLALESIDIFVAPYPALRSIIVGKILTDKYRIIIHVNTTERERAKVKKYIVRPYTFCVFPKEPDEKLLYILDFEHGYDDGVLKSAAIGRYTSEGHHNYGMLDITADFVTVRDAALDLIQREIITPTKQMDSASQPEQNKSLQ